MKEGAKRVVDKASKVVKRVIKNAKKKLKDAF